MVVSIDIEVEATDFRLTACSSRSPTSPPKEMTNRIGSSDQALSEHLRRGAHNLVEASVVPERDAD